MNHFLSKKVDPNSPKGRYAIGKLLGYVGIGLNFLLFITKYTIGWMVNSVSIKGDAINNLTDFLSNIISIFAFRISEKPADKEHPYGHGRTETISALFMGMIILTLGIEMVKQSFEKILNPTPVHFEWAPVVVLVLSIAVKLYMYSYNHKYAKIYHSELLEANAIDSRNDIIGTTMILISTLISPLIHYDLDGLMGLMISGIIFYSAWGLLKEVISTLLGEAPSIQKVNEIVDIILEHPMALEVHDVMIHSYGPQYMYATAHVEVDGTLDLMAVHSEVDRIEREVSQKLNIDLVTHIDPILLHDKETMRINDMLLSIIASIQENWGIQDFRVENSDGKTRVFFDLIVPYEEKRSEEEIRQLIWEKIPDCENYKLKMRLVHPYS